MAKLKGEADLNRKIRADEAAKDLAVEMTELCQSIFQEGWCGAFTTTKLDKSSDVWGLCPNYLDTAENGMADPAKVTANANAEYKRKLAADDAAAKAKSQAELPTITEETTEKSAETGAEKSLETET